MSIEKKFVTAEEQSSLTMADQHALEYLRSGGERGHIWDFTVVGGYPWTPCLVLETFGAKTGERRLAPLIYGAIDGAFVIVASKGGAPHHPGWYHNIRAKDEVTIQIASQAFACEWYEPEGEDFTRVWEYMADLYPPYRDYQKSTERKIPVVMFKVLREVELLAL
jgi:deazaflavin-dependent oxidoreductase (nitroreductase family)